MILSKRYQIDTGVKYRYNIVKKLYIAIRNCIHFFPHHYTQRCLNVRLNMEFLLKSVGYAKTVITRTSEKYTVVLILSWLKYIIFLPKCNRQLTLLLLQRQCFRSQLVGRSLQIFQTPQKTSNIDQGQTLHFTTK